MSDPAVARAMPHVATLHDALEAGIARLRASGSGSARLDAELLLAHALGTDRTGILAHPDVVLGPGARERYESALARRERGEPVAYIRGIKEFHGLAFAVDDRALIPRPETELLVDLAVARIADALTRAPRPPGMPPLRVLDVGTGSGAIAVSVLVACRRRGFGPALRAVATDLSPAALELAIENAVAHGVADAIEFRVADLLSDVALRDGPYDLVLANLPYIPSPEVPRLPVAASFEPTLALDGGPDGLDLVRRALRALPAALAADGVALLEIGAGQAPGVSAEIQDVLGVSDPGHRWALTIHPDLAGIPRVAEVSR